MPKTTPYVDWFCPKCKRRRRNPSRDWWDWVPGGWRLVMASPTGRVWSLLQTFDKTLSPDWVVVYHVVHPKCGHRQAWRQDKVQAMLAENPAEIRL